jgi:iron complex transport system substrate-binding protein
MRAIDGDLIVTADYASEEAPQVEELSRNPLWKTLPAVRAGRVVAIPGEIYNGGTYVAAQMLLERLAEELEREAP